MLSPYNFRNKNSKIYGIFLYIKKNFLLEDINNKHRGRKNIEKNR